MDSEPAAPKGRPTGRYGPWQLWLFVALEAIGLLALMVRMITR